MEQIKIPKSIDDPLKLLIWDIRDVIPAVACIMVGILVSHLWPFLVLGFGTGWLSRKFRDRRQDGWGLHSLYWMGLLPLKQLPNPFIRRFLP